MAALYDYAIRNGERVFIEDVETGRNCNCLCPNCNAPLEARNRKFEGRKKAPYFAHVRGYDCVGGDETVIHRLTKEVIQECGGLMLPSDGPYGAPEGFVKLHDIEVEWSDRKYEFIPDVTGILPDGRRLYIECYVTHKVSPKKRKAIIDNELLCVEIEMCNEAPDKKIIEEIILNGTENRQWIVRTDETLSDNSNISVSYPHPEHEKAIELTEQAFNEKRLSIISEIQYDDNLNFHTLHYYHFDKCLKKTKFRGYSSDILLYCDNKKDRHQILINFRFKKRRKGFIPPSDFRMIDIYIGGSRSVFDIFERLKKGLLSTAIVGMDFIGCWNYENLKYFTLDDKQEYKDDLFGDV